ncbi:MAG TPA: lysozyme inhibitor LprI family protein [Patescibacteria group bacterium]|nr:lysozyme inhibitor LprI family protein [Patescibacteria group bacterium]
MQRALLIFILLIAICTPWRNAIAETSVEECLATARGTPGIGLCLGAQHTAIEKQFEDVTFTAKQDAIRIDKDTPSSGVLEKFTKSDESFRAYMRAQCDYIYARYGQGTGASNAYVGCENKLMRERIKMFEAK